MTWKRLLHSYSLGIKFCLNLGDDHLNLGDDHLSPGPEKEHHPPSTPPLSGCFRNFLLPDVSLITFLSCKAAHVPFLSHQLQCRVWSPQHGIQAPRAQAPLPLHLPLLPPLALLFHLMSLFTLFLLPRMSFLIFSAWWTSTLPTNPKSSFLWNILPPQQVENRLLHETPQSPKDRDSLIHTGITPVSGFPCGSAGKESACNAGRPGFDPRVGKIPWRRERLPTPVFWLGEFHGLHSSWHCKEWDTTEQLYLLTLPPYHNCLILFPYIYISVNPENSLLSGSEAGEDLAGKIGINICWGLQWPRLQWDDVGEGTLV